jgi:hypothetical protein
MDKTLGTMFYRMGENVVGYLPNLLGGIALLVVGWVLGWIVKRIVIQVCVLLRFERILMRMRWGRGFAKADIRYALFNTIGSLAFFIVFLVFANGALDAMKLTILSALIEKGVLFVPKLLIAIVIIGFGSMIAGWVGMTVARALGREGVQGAALLGRIARAVVVLFFAAMALTELDIARQVVLIGYSVTMITLGVLTIVLVLLGGHRVLGKVLKNVDQ